MGNFQYHLANPLREGKHTQYGVNFFDIKKHWVIIKAYAEVIQIYEFINDKLEKKHTGHVHCSLDAELDVIL